MEVTKMRQWLEEFRTLVANTSFELQVVEGILYPYLNVQDETKYLKYISGEEVGNISDSLGNTLLCRYTENPLVYVGRMVVVDLVLIGYLPFCSDIRKFADLIIKRLQDRLVVEGDILLQTNILEVFRTEFSDDTKKLKKEVPMFTISFSIRVPQDSICLTTLEDLVCECENPSMFLSC
jgi:hypothetical protein